MFGLLNVPPLFCSKCGAYDTPGMTFLKSNLVCRDCWSRNYDVNIS